MDYQLLIGDCLETLKTLPEKSVHTCVTSPPYFGLRDYGVEGQLGAEPTPGEFVEALVRVFREVWRVLRDDGTVWLNLGDSYNAYNGNRGASKGPANGRHHEIMPELPKGAGLTVSGLKNKDLIGIPWRVAFALQQPYYTGKIRKEADRIWLAAIIDGEGCFFIHKRKAGSSSGAKFKRADGEEVNYARVADTYSVGLEICNTNLAIIERIQAVAGRGSIRTQTPEQNSRRKQTIYRWRCAPSEAREIAQEVYPHLVGKQRQARLIYGAPTTGEDAAGAHQAIMDLHNGVETSVDLPEPPTMFEPGWYLRQDVIWAKPNPMPESVRDRCTKAHEYVFLLSKSPKYYYDHEAAKEPVQSNKGNGRSFRGGGSYTGGNSFNNHAVKGRETHGNAPNESGKRNRRSVWTVSTRPYKGAHFATFPPALIAPCILAGCPEGGTVLDPFGGSGTTAGVALAHNREAILCELNPEYAELVPERIDWIMDYYGARQPALKDVEV